MELEPDQPRIVGPGFRDRVLEVVARIPSGRVSTYGDIARILGSVRVARHVGFALAAPTDLDVPWHRVVRSDGRIAFDPRDSRGRAQREALDCEGIEVTGSGRVVDFRALRVSTRSLG